MGRSCTAGRWALAALLAVACTAVAEDFDTLAPEPVSACLPASQAAGADFHVVDPVAGDGLMHRYVLESRYGRFDAYGAEGVAGRIHEVESLATLARTTDVGVVVDAVGGRITGSAQSVIGVATHPIDTVVGIPRGISHLFRGYAAQARELGDSTGGADASGAGPAAPAASDAKRYVGRYFGVSASERAWYRKLAVDPYTDNEPLRHAVARLARIDATAKFGLKFAPLPGIPYAGEAARAMDAIYNEHPAVLRERRRARLAAYGLTGAEVHAFENTLVLNPTRQQMLDEAAVRLEGVAGRDQLFRHAIGITSEAEATVYVRSALALAARHAATPLATLLPGIRMPAARAVDGTIVVVAAFDAVRWTADVSAAETAARAALPAGTTAPELWLAAAPSPRAAAELGARGWRVRYDGEPPASPP